MKELTIEEKAKSFNEALSRAKGFYKRFPELRDILEKIFPELRESEDEKTKRVLHSIANKMSQHLRDIFSEEEFQCYDAWSNAWLEKQGEQKSWSEEDENNILFLTSIIEECFKDKEKITLYSDTVCANFTKEDVIDRLKSLKPQSTWKPDELQLEFLSDAIKHYNSLGYPASKLKELLDDLKKLREEKL